MAIIIIGEIQKWIPAIHVLVLSIGTLLSFITAYVNKHVSIYLPFISETGAYSPEMCIFSLTLIIGSFIGCIVIFLNFMIFSSLHINEMRHFEKLNIFAALVGFGSMIGLAGVAAFPMTTVFSIHLVVAAMYFVGSGVYFICVTYISKRLYGKSTILTLRYILTAAMMLFLILIVFFFPISLKNWHEIEVIIPALKEPHNEGFWLIFISAILEWLIVGTVIFFHLTFMKELQVKKIFISVCPEDCKRDSNAEDPPQINEDAAAVDE